MKTIIPTVAKKLPDSLKSGNVYMSVMIEGKEPPKIRIARMYFTPGSRTAWHTHAGGEYLYVLEGVALVQEKDGRIEDLYAGDMIFTEPGVEHWHGAAKDSFMILLAIWGAPVVGEGEAETEWGAEVTDEDAGMSEDKEVS